MGDFSKVNPVFGTAVDFGLNMLASDIAANRQLSHSKEFFDYTFNKQNQRQDFLNFNAATIQKQSLRNAGLSAASLNASPFSPNVASGSGITGSDRMAEVNLFSNMLAAKQLEMQEKITDADVRLKDSETQQNIVNTQEIEANAESMRSLQHSQTLLNTALIDKSNKEVEALTQSIKNDVQRVQNETNLNDAKINEIQQSINNLKTENDINLKQLSYTDQLLAAQVYEMRSRGDLNNAQASKAYSDIQVNNENMNLIRANVGLTENEALKVSAYTNLLDEQTSREHFDNKIRLLVGYDKYKKMEEAKLLEPMYNNALALQSLKNGETQRRVTALRGSVGAFTDVVNSLKPSK